MAFLATVNLKLAVGVDHELVGLELHQRAIERPGHCGRQKRALSQLLQHDEDESVRGRIASALGQARLGAAVDPLVSALGDRSPAVRASTAEALGEIGDPRARSALEKSARSDPDSAVRASAAAAIEKLRATETGSENR